MKEYLTLISGPASLALTVEDAKTAIRVCDDADDSYIRTLIQSAIRNIDGRDGYLGRALIKQTWRLVMSKFPCGKIKIPLPPLRTILSIKYTDADGAEQTIDPSAYRVVTDIEPGYVEPVYGTSWPSPRCQDDAVKVEFTAGYGVSWDKVPSDIRTYLGMQVAEWYMNRELSIVGTSISEVPHVRNMLENYRIRNVTNAGGETQ